MQHKGKDLERKHWLIIAIALGITIGLVRVSIAYAYETSIMDNTNSIVSAPQLGGPQVLTVPSMFGASTTLTLPSSTAKPVKPIPLPPIAVIANTNSTPSNSSGTIGTPTSTSQFSQPAQSPALPPIVALNPSALVGVLCYFNTSFTAANGRTAQGTQEEVRGSGVIINSKGDILTNRHIVVQSDIASTIVDQNGNNVGGTIRFSLDHCQVGQLPAGSTLPTPQEIESFNPYVQIPLLAYEVTPIYLSPTAAPGLSHAESQYADFAILRITGITPQAPTFNIHSVPSSFPYAQLLPIVQYNLVNQQVLTYGFPGDVTSGQGNAFETFTMTGSVGSVTGVYGGDQNYLNVPLSINTDMEIYHGRSGSPLIWRGYVIGVVTFFENANRTESGSVASDAVIKALQGMGELGV